MLIYKQRYKPRITREFTKSDLTVYDSAGNTALNALTVFGKSEVVGGAIVSAGEGWATVDLGTLNWGYSSSYQTPVFSALLSTIGGVPESINFICPNYKPKKYFWETPNNDMCIASSRSYLIISNSNYTDATAFKTAMTGVLLCYELADPTQGNAIAVKTDNGSGIDGTMATFTTGIPLRGITGGARDVAVWDGMSGEVTKYNAEVDLGTLTWTFSTPYNNFVATIADILEPVETGDRLKGLLTPNYPPSLDYRLTNQTDKSILKVGTSIYIKDTDYGYDATAFANAMSGVKLIYELATPTTESLTTAENASIAGLRTLEPQTHAQNNAQTNMTVDYTIRVPTI